MQTMQDWGALGEIIGGIAVLFTIVYLALQLRRSTRATHRQTYQAAAESLAQFSLDLAKAPHLQRLFRNALQAPESLADDELLQGFSILDAYLSLMESFYLHNREFGEVLSQARWTRMLTRILRMPGGARYWQERRWQFHEQFASYMDELSREPRAA
jgi:hypothetical protein